MLPSGHSWAQSTSNLIQIMVILVAALNHTMVIAMAVMRIIMRRVTQNTSLNIPGSLLWLYQLLFLTPSCFSTFVLWKRAPCLHSKQKDKRLVNANEELRSHLQSLSGLLLHSSAYSLWQFNRILLMMKNISWLVTAMVMLITVI
jgi:hypothetical protein